jgi:hypothetical protein
MKLMIVAIAVGFAVGAGGAAVADTLTSSRGVDFYSAGKHKFYVWCADNRDYNAIAGGASAEDAQMKLYDAVKASGHTACWPVWQGKIPG